MTGTGLGVGSMTGGALGTLSTKREPGLREGFLRLEEEPSDAGPGPKEPSEVPPAGFDFGCEESIDFRFRGPDGFPFSTRGLLVSTCLESRFVASRRPHEAGQRDWGSMGAAVGQEGAGFAGGLLACGLLALGRRTTRHWAGTKRAARGATSRR